jgi:hypothetical protein
MNPGPYEIEVWHVDPETLERTLIDTEIVEIGSGYKIINYDGLYVLRVGGMGV